MYWSTCTGLKCSVSPKKTTPSVASSKATAIVPIPIARKTLRMMGSQG
jgi:hypothetical protein